MIKDIRGSNKFTNTKQELINEIISKSKEKTLPTMILYDQKGLEIFDRITYHPDYYLTNSEIDILEKHADKIVKMIKNGDSLIELGVGAMRKTKLLLDAIQKANLTVTYYAVDLDESSIKKSIEPLKEKYPAIEFVGLWGTYHDSLSFVQKNVIGRKMYLWLGSSIGNLTREEATVFLKTFCSDGMSDGDLFLCGIDRRNNPEKVGRAYDDRDGLTRDFAINGLHNINYLFGFKLYDPAAFDYVSIYNDQEGRHEAYFRPKYDHTIESKEHGLSVSFTTKDLINFEYSYKYSMEEVLRLVELASLSYLGKLTDKDNLFYKSRFVSEKATTNCPSIQEWEALWKSSITLTDKLISSSRMLQKPISLRHPYIFYLGHLPVFLDIQISKVVGDPVEPIYYQEIFERGIDPLMEDPSQCHGHSKVPDCWPKMEEIIEYRNRVHEKVRKIVKNPISKRLSRLLSMAFEHEAMHIETLLYMYVQDETIEHNNLFPLPFLETNSGFKVANWIFIPENLVTFGANSIEIDDMNVSPETSFAWDNEYPLHSKTVPGFQIQHRPVSIREYLQFYEAKGSLKVLTPASWIKKNNIWCVKSIYGPIDMSNCLDWPVYVSNNQANLYASHYGCQLPTEEQIVSARSITRPSLTDNHSFKNLIPQNVVVQSDKVTDLIGNGWEWTCSIFSPFEGFVQSEIYPGYSADFFDNKHAICLGGSFATSPRLLRDSFRNWYQHEYPYVFSKFRLVKK